LNRKTDDLPMTKELGLEPRSLHKRARLTESEMDRKFAALRSRREPSVPAQLALDGLDRFLRRKRRLPALRRAVSLVYRFLT